ncbi:hypothetical protein ACR9PT_01915 [Piscirickettsia salmonis]|uniref:hypothetical protein n=1 Tax=Piscirickettsia salmonis TaxID=1238 RepID=UPI003EBA57BA
MPNTTIKVIKQGKGAAVGKDNEDIILLTGSMYGGGDLNENTAIVARSELGSGLFCAKETSLANTCAGWLKNLKETLGEEIKFYISGKPSEHHEQELQVLCEQEGIQAKIFIKKTPSSLTLAANYTEILYQQDLTELTGCYLFSYSLSQEIQKAIKQLNERIKKPGFFSDTTGRQKSVEELGGLQELIEGAGKKHLRPLDFDFYEYLKKEFKEYRSKYLGRQDTDTVSNLLKKIDEIFSTQTFTKTKFSLPMPPTTATWYDAPPPASPKLSEFNTAELPPPSPLNTAEDLSPATEIETTPTTPPPPPPAALKADAKARHEAAMAAQVNPMEFSDNNAEDLPTPPSPIILDSQQSLTDFDDSDFPPLPPPPLSNEEQMSLANFDDAELPPPPLMDFETGPETQNPEAVVEVEAEEKVTEAVKPQTATSAISAAFSAITARRQAVEESDSEESDSDSKSNEGEDEADSSSSTLFQRRQSQGQQSRNSNELQHS